MRASRRIAIGGVLTGLAVLFQIVPVFLTEVFVLVTMLSALPIYIISRLHPGMGTGAFFVAGCLIMLVSPHEGIFFFCTNGPVGLVLGVCAHHRWGKVAAASSTGLVLGCTLSFVSYVIGIPVFGAPLPGGLGMQLLILGAFSVVYSLIYLYFGQFVYRLLDQLYSFEKELKRD